jgi:hypothetical protein
MQTGGNAQPGRRQALQRAQAIEYDKGLPKVAFVFAGGPGGKWASSPAFALAGAKALAGSPQVARKPRSPRVAAGSFPAHSINKTKTAHPIGQAVSFCWWTRRQLKRRAYLLIRLVFFKTRKFDRHKCRHRGETCVRTATQCG